jgi:hypothetical protein
MTPTDPQGLTPRDREWFEREIVQGTDNSEPSGPASEPEIRDDDREPADVTIPAPPD